MLYSDFFSKSIPYLLFTQAFNCGVSLIYIVLLPLHLSEILLNYIGVKAKQNILILAQGKVDIFSSQKRENDFKNESDFGIQRFLFAASVAS